MKCLKSLMVQGWQGWSSSHCRGVAGAQLGCSGLAAGILQQLAGTRATGTTARCRVPCEWPEGWAKTWVGIPAGLGWAGQGLAVAQLLGILTVTFPHTWEKGEGPPKPLPCPLHLQGQTLRNWKITAMAVAFEVSVIPDFYLFHWDLQISIFNALIE